MSSLTSSPWNRNKVNLELNAILIYKSSIQEFKKMLRSISLLSTSQRPKSFNATKNTARNIPHLDVIHIPFTSNTSFLWIIRLLRRTTQSQMSIKLIVRFCLSHSTSFRFWCRGGGNLDQRLF